MSYLFTSESVSEGHPDKVADQISDALLDEFLRWDPNSKVACETLVTTGLVLCAGEVKTKGYVNIDEVVRKTIKYIGYDKAEYRFEADSCGIISTIHEQSPDIHQGVARKSKLDQGAGDQGMMFGYAIDEMDNYMPVASELAHILLQELAIIRKEGKEMTYLRPDSKSQVTVEYSDDRKPLRIDTMVVSTQHDEFGTQEEMQERIREDILNILIPRIRRSLPGKIKEFFSDDFTLYVNPTGKFVIGGPHGDTGLTGRKIIVDTYGGYSAHGGGAFSGKDASKVDRSASYAARHIAKNIVAAGIAREALVQIAYAIGVAQPVGLYIHTNGSTRITDKKGNPLGDSAVAKKISRLFDLRPYAIIKKFGLLHPIFSKTSVYGHFGRDPYEQEVEVYYKDKETVTRMDGDRERYFKKVPFFAWEKLDMVDKIRKEFNL